MSQLPSFFIDSNLIPANRRAQHRKAIDVIEAHERGGVPFVLMLQSYRVVTRIVRSETDVGDWLENLRTDWRPVGVGFVEVQPQGDLSDLLFDREAAHVRAEIYAPSLVVADATWFDAVTYLIERAEMIVVLMGIDSGGLVRELKALVGQRRQDRTIVLYSELIADAMSFLDPFPRVVSLADLDPRDPLGTFVFSDLNERLIRIRDTPKMPVPVIASGLRDGFRDLAIKCRRESRGTGAGRYFANAACLALEDGDWEAAVQLTEARVELVSNDENPQLRRAFARARPRAVDCTPRETDERPRPGNPARRLGVRPVFRTIE
jgi:hypothetical protein